MTEQTQTQPEAGASQDSDRADLLECLLTAQVLTLAQTYKGRGEFGGIQEAVSEIVRQRPTILKLLAERLRPVDVAPPTSSSSVMPQVAVVQVDRLAKWRGFI